MTARPSEPYPQTQAKSRFSAPTELGELCRGELHLISVYECRVGLGPIWASIS